MSYRYSTPPIRRRCSTRQLHNSFTALTRSSWTMLFVNRRLTSPEFALMLAAPRRMRMSPERKSGGLSFVIWPSSAASTG